MLTRRSLFGLAGAAGASSLALWSGSSLSLSGCSSDEGGGVATDRGTVLDSLVRQVFRPGFEPIKAQGDALVAALDALAAGPTVATLTAAREAWSTLRGSFRRTAAYGIGYDDIAVTGLTIEEPTNTAKVEELAKATAPVNPKTTPANARGFLAIEYLLFDPARDDATIAASFAAPDGGGRASLLQVLGVDLRDKLQIVPDLWLTGGFDEQVRTAGAGSTEYTSQKAVFDALLNLTLKITDRCIDIVRKSAGLPALDKAAPTADRSDRTLTDLLDDLVGIEAVYAGGSVTLGSIVVEVNPGADQAMRAAIADARAALSAFPAPLRTAVPANQAAADELILKLRALKAALGTGVFGALGTATLITDKDGD